MSEKIARTPEEIAAEVVTVIRDSNGWLIMLHGHEAEWLSDREGADLDALSLRKAVAEVIRSAMQTALDCPPLREEQLSDIRDWQNWVVSNKPQNAPRWPSHKPAYELVGMLLALIDHLRTQVRWLVQDDPASLEAFEAGRRTGRLEGRKEYWLALTDEAEARHKVADTAGTGSPNWAQMVAIARHLDHLAVRLASKLPWDRQEKT